MKKLSPEVFEAFRFIAVGGMSTAITYIVYYILLLEDIGAVAAYTVGYIVGLIFNYMMSARFTFKKSMNFKNAVGFVLTNAFNYALQVGLLWLFIYWGVPEKIAPLPMYAVAVPVNFLMVRTVFKKL